MKSYRLILNSLFVSLITGSVPAEEGAGNLGIPEKVLFNRDVRTIFSKTCFACHGPDANARKADLRLDVRKEAIADRKGERPVFPGDPEKSLAYQLITAGDPDDQMPPADFHTQLTAREKAIIGKWIEQGAEYETHWAFIPPTRPVAPKVKLESLVRSQIDHFVLAKLEAGGVAPSKSADRNTLIRRVSLDLTGLPPTPDQVRAFLNDPAGDDEAYGKVVDQLLKSPRFGEHFARHWLDAARYADTSGYQYDRIRHQWVWRDWVINAFNSNMPFDRFTIEQNAGDLLPDASNQTRLATGFHRNHPITIEGGVIDEEYRTEYVMDRVVTTTTTWLGLTFTCARCHDHKYDPIGMDDFYSFFAFFNNVPERGLNGFSPKAKIESPLGGNLSELSAQIAKAEQRLDRALANVKGSLPAWETKLRQRAEAESNAVRIDAATAGGGTKIVPQKDGSLLATGPNPATQTYQIDFTLGKTATSAIKLEALTHESHVNKSTGRGHNGNFVLSEVTVEVAPGAPGSSFKPVSITAAEANYEQSGYPVAAAIDGKHGRSGWAIDGNTRFADSSAVFTLAESIAPGSRIRVKLIHTWGGSHTIGRFRLSVPSDGEAPIPGEIKRILATDGKQRSKSDQQQLSRYLAGKFGVPEFARTIDKINRLKARLAAEKSTAVPETMILTSLPTPRKTHVLMRGEYDKPIKERPVVADVPQVFGGLPDGLPRNRLGLAKWLVSGDNPLTSRVIVNRFWAQLFGIGLVKTIEDFGSQGEYPTHPELLDWLAVSFVESGWDVKRLLKEMVMSGTYRQASRVTPAMEALDPENRLLERGPRFRLDAEMIRDSALSVSGLLDESIGGPSVYPYHPKGLWMEINNRPGYSRAYPHSKDQTQLYRRSMYTFWKRTVPPPSMATFDAPEREFCVVQRSRTNTPLQAFVMLHDPQFVEAARRLAERMIQEGGSDPNERLAHGFELCMARKPGARELSLLRNALEARLIRFQDTPESAAKVLSVGQSPTGSSIDNAELAAYTTIGRMILNLSEFITKG